MGTWCKGFWSWCGGFLYEPVFKKFLFSWENLPETDDDKERLQKFLKDDLDIGWVQDVEIKKRDENKTIVISKDNDSVKITIDEQEEKATLKISDDKSIDLKVKKKGGKLYFIEFPHSQVWRVLATVIVVILGLLLCIKGELIIIGEPHDHLAICFLWLLILYLSLILWLPFRNIWECIERVNYAKMRAGLLRQQISVNLNVTSLLVAFSIAFIVTSLSIFFTHPLEGNKLTVFKLVMGFLVTGVIFLVVTLEFHLAPLNPAFDSAQIETLYTRGWWLYTIGLYEIVVGLLFYVYLLEPLITIIGVIIFIVAFTYYLITPCAIKSGYQNWRIDK